MTEVDPRLARLENLRTELPTEELVAALAREDGGVAGMLDFVFHEIAGTFDPDKAGDQQGSFRMDVRTPDGITGRFVSVADGGCTVSPASGREATVTMVMDITDFLAVATGRLTGSDAYMTGKLQVSGDLFFAMNWSDWFGTI